MRKITYIFVTIMSICAFMAVQAYAITIVWSEMATGTVGMALYCNGEIISYDYHAREDGHQKFDSSLSMWDGEIDEYVHDGVPMDSSRLYVSDLQVFNPGPMETFSRVTMHRYFMDSSGRKLQSLDPSFIDIFLCKLDTCFIFDDTMSTNERLIVYYDRWLDVGALTPVFMHGISISDDVLLPCISRDVVSSDSGSVVEFHDYRSNGMRVHLDVMAESVQGHNGQYAIESCWGRAVSVWHDDTGGYRVSLLD